MLLHLKSFAKEEKKLLNFLENDRTYFWNLNLDGEKWIFDLETVTFLTQEKYQIYHSILENRRMRKNTRQRLDSPECLTSETWHLDCLQYFECVCLVDKWEGKITSFFRIILNFCWMDFMQVCYSHSCKVAGWPCATFSSPRLCWEISLWPTLVTASWHIILHSRSISPLSLWDIFEWCEYLGRITIEKMI